MRLLLAVAALLLSAPHSMACKSEVEGWVIRMDASGVIMGRNYQDGSRLYLLATPTLEWVLGVSNPSWTLQEGATTDIAVRIDGKFVASGKATVNNKRLLLPLSGDALFFRALRDGQQLDLESPHGKRSFLLSGVPQAVMTVIECALTLRLPSRPPQAAKPPAPDAQAVPRAEAMEMLIKLLNAAGARGYRLGPPDKDAGARITFALADGTLGMFLAMRGLGTPDAEEYASYIIGQMSEACKGGNFLSWQAIDSIGRRQCRAQGREHLSHT